MAEVVAVLGHFVAFLISALITSVAFYLKKKDQDFDLVKMAETLLTAAILATVGFVMFLVGLLPEPSTTDAMAYVSTLGLAGPFSLFVQALAQIVYRRFHG